MNFDFLSPLLGSLSRVHINFVTALRGQAVGQDEFGNRYYQSRKTVTHWQGGIHSQHKRWVMYAHRADGSEVPPEWHGWLHHQTDITPNTAAAAQYRRPWQKPYIANMTGTSAAYVPPGHQSTGKPRAKATGDYQAWRPS
jgi:NADH:ubiquinone oxidoreductase subunit